MTPPDGTDYASGGNAPTAAEWRTEAMRLRDALLEIERHCPCGARPESPDTHPHVIGCPVARALLRETS